MVFWDDCVRAPVLYLMMSVSFVMKLVMVVLENIISSCSWILHDR